MTLRGQRPAFDSRAIGEMARPSGEIVGIHCRRAAPRMGDRSVATPVAHYAAAMRRLRLMLADRPWPVVALVVWTLFVWVQRVINIARDDSLQGGDLLGALVRPVAFVAVAGWVAAMLARTADVERLRRPVGVACLVTAALWLVQPVIIAMRDYSVGFVVVHAVLGAVSVSLAWMAWRSVRRPSGAGGDRESVDGAVRAAVGGQ